RAEKRYVPRDRSQRSSEMFEECDRRHICGKVRRSSTARLIAVPHWGALFPVPRTDLFRDGVVSGVICGAVLGAVDGRSFVTSSAGGPPMAMSGIPTTFAPALSSAAAPVPPYPTPTGLPPAANPTLELASKNETANATSFLLVIYPLPRCPLRSSQL